MFACEVERKLRLAGPEDRWSTLASVVQDLSMARDLDAIIDIVRCAARELTGADGATFVLRDGDLCYYAAEHAIGPLWAGRRFPLEACVSGWVMQHREPVVIEDIYTDARVPVDAYRPTFVKSLAMVPIRTKAPVGAIGNYWAMPYRATQQEVALLQALADSTSVAMENVAVRAELEKRVEERTRELEESCRKLAELERQREAQSELLVHDLRSPAAAIMTSAMVTLRNHELSRQDRSRWRGVLSAADHIQRTALNLLDIARSQDGGLALKPVAIDISALLIDVCELLLPHAERREQRIEIRSDLPPGALCADEELLRRVLQNLVDNALRHGPPGSAVRVEATASSDDWLQITVSDEGPGIPEEQRARVFERYVRLANGPQKADTGRGLGLTFCRLAVEAHGGAIWVEGNEPQGSRFCIRLPAGGAALS